MSSMNFVFLCLCLSVSILHINRTFFSFGTNFVFDAQNSCVCSDLVWLSFKNVIYPHAKHYGMRNANNTETFTWYEKQLIY